MNDFVQCKESHYGDCAHRPDAYGILIPGKRGRIFSILYTTAGEGPHPTVLLFHGIPGCEQNSDMAHFLRRNGFHVMIFHYSGSWGSDGEYSLKNDLEDANTVLDYILNDETYGFDKTRIYTVGHSMGGFVCGQILAKRPEVRGGVLLMPCDVGRLSLIAKEDARTHQFVQEVFDDSAQWLNGVTGEGLMREAEDNSEAFRLENVARELAKKPILCVQGTLDIYTPYEQNCRPLEQAIQAAGGTMFEVIHYPTDHSFSDYRLTVAGTISEYLKKLISA